MLLLICMREETWVNKKFRLIGGNDYTYNFWTRLLRSSIEVDFCQSMTGVMGKAETPEYKSSDAPCASMIISRVTRVGGKSTMKIGFSRCWGDLAHNWNRKWDICLAKLSQQHSCRYNYQHGEDFFQPPNFKHRRLNFLFTHVPSFMQNKSSISYTNSRRDAGYQDAKFHSQN